MTAAERRIGGYFGLESQAGSPLPWFDQAVAVQSGRMALHLALPPVPATLWLPAYFCPPVAESLAMSGWTLRRYALGEDFGPGPEVEPADGDRVILVDYFGLGADGIDRAIARIGAARCIVDACMALFANIRDGVPTAFSPRKFAGLPDGGLLVSACEVPRLSPADEAGSQGRSAHLHKRAAGDIDGGRADFAAAEASLDRDASPQAMSRLTRQILGAIDFPRIAACRRDNVRRLSSGLRALGFHPLADVGASVPLCWPVPGMDPGRWRQRLAERGIYCAAYWPDMVLPEVDRVARHLTEACTFLPIDQRYGNEDMDYMLAVIEDLRRHA